MDINTYISNQPFERQDVLSNIHKAIIEYDKTIQGNVELMMGKEMIVYKGKGYMKYGLSGGKNYMSLHAMPIYGSTALHTKYKALLPHANFQKGCINFKSQKDLPLGILNQLISDCAKIDLLEMKETYLKSKKKG